MSAKHYIRPLSEKIPNCPTCGNRMWRLHDPLGEYFICKAVRHGECNQRSPGKMHDEWYRKKFFTKGDGQDGLMRVKAHGVFDKLWKENGLTRNDSYKVLQKIMNRSEEDAHISRFSAYDCEVLIKRLKELGDAVFVLAPEEQA